MKDILKWIVFGGLFAVPFLTLYVENEYFLPFITGKNFWFRIIVDLVFVAWIALALLDTKYRPRWSWVFGTTTALIVVMFFANLFGEHPASSFWSNFERMDGYVSLVHMYLYMVVIGSVLQSKTEWRWFLNTSLIVAMLVAIGGLSQYFSIPSIASVFGINPNLPRLDSTLGNAAYMAVYTLFHIFIAAWLLLSARSPWQIGAYVLSILTFVFVLIETGTRGTAVGLAVGAVTCLAFITAFARKESERTLRTAAASVLALLVFMIGGFIAIKDTAFVQNQTNLSRIANISFEELEIRSIIWGMAWEGVQERPVLGWGQSNFNYVFNDHYDPRLYAQEQWFDRAHNIFMDWLIAGGFVGLLVYLSVFAACLYYLVVQPFRTKEETFTVAERGILLGLLAGYFTHNLVVFDNIVSYIFFAVILGFIHNRVAKPIKQIKDKKVHEQIVAQAYLPAAALVFGLVVLFVHMPGMSAAADIIKAYRSLQPTVEFNVQRPPAGPAAMLEHFEAALDRESFGQQEIAEQIAQQTMGLYGNEQVPEDVRRAFAETAERELAVLAERKPGDARVHVFISSYYRALWQAETALGNTDAASQYLEQAAQEMAIARTLSPQKQSIIDQQGFIELSRSNIGGAHEFFETSFNLDTDNHTAREYYAASLINIGEIEAALALLDSQEARARLAQSEYLMNTALRANAQPMVVELYKERTVLTPDDPQAWASLAFLYFDQGERGLAIQTLREGGESIPTFTETANCIATNIEQGSDTPQVGC